MGLLQQQVVQLLQCGLQLGVNLLEGLAGMWWDACEDRDMVHHSELARVWASLWSVV